MKKDKMIIVEFKGLSLNGVELISPHSLSVVVQTPLDDAPTEIVRVGSSGSINAVSALTVKLFHVWLFVICL